MAAPALLKGTAFLTGAASGIGKATAFAFAKHGIKAMTLCDISKNNLSITQKEMKAQFPNVQVETIALDVSDNAAVEKSILHTVEKFGRIDVGFNCAGIAGAGLPTADGTVKDWLDVVDINLNGVYRCHRALIQAMLKQEDLGPRLGRGSIINMASMFGLAGTPGDSLGASSPYCGSKHGVVGLTKADAAWYAPQKIRINAICPGYVETPLLEAASIAGAMAGEVAKTPMKRMAQPVEIADTVVFLASPMASFMTGSALLADGGYTISVSR